MNIVHLDFQGRDMTFRQDGWFNATNAAAAYGKEPSDWLRQRETVEYLDALCRHSGNTGNLPEINEIKALDGSSAASRAALLRLAKKTGFVSTKSGPVSTGGGTWLHPKLAVAFARWLDVDFAVWCDQQIDQLIRGGSDRVLAIDSKRAMGRVVTDMLQDVLLEAGKAPKPHHFQNEHRLCNLALNGRFEGIDESQLTAQDARRLADIRRKDAVLIARGFDYQERKRRLIEFAEAEGRKHLPSAA